MSEPMSDEWLSQIEAELAGPCTSFYSHKLLQCVAEIRRLRAELHEAQERCCRDVEELQALWPDDWRRVETLQMAAQAIRQRMKKESGDAAER